ncbi:MAG TPA: hypothetical protein VMT29_13120 [Steroidobacteraceae bacterium]|nr:hypothetical protein [Steroidobacteraceae bacterium]
MIAAAVALALGTNAAHALAPGATLDAVFYEAGGSAQENAAFASIYTLLTPSTVDIYTDQTTGALSPNYLIVTGTTNAAGNTALGLSSSENILYFYKFNGGSFPNGAFPFAFPTSDTTNSVLNYPVTSAIGTSVATANASPATNPSSPTYKFTATGTATDPHSPDFGLTDVEVPIFNNLFNLNGVTALTSSQLAGIQQDGIYIDVFGVAVTNAVFQGTGDFAGHAKTNFTKQEVAAILTGAFQNWNKMFDDNGNQMPNKPIWLLDRGSGSGTKASGNQYFLNYPGALGASGALTPRSVNSSSVNNYTDTILDMTLGYQDVKEASTAAVVTDLQNANGAGHGAITILAAEVPPALNQVGGVSQYSFVKIGGVGIDTANGSTDDINTTGSTKYTNVVTGAYDFAYQNSFNTRVGLIPTGTCTSVTSANAKMACAIRTALTSENISAAHVGSALPNGVTGLLIDPVKAPAQDAGVVMWTRNKNSTKPILANFDATTVSGGHITYGSDPL